MNWIVIGAEGLVIVTIIVWMVIKKKAIGKAEEDIPQDQPKQPEIDLPNEEKWE